jgi:hypothetical protein
LQGRTWLGGGRTQWNLEQPRLTADQKNCVVALLAGASSKFSTIRSLPLDRLDINIDRSSSLSAVLLPRVAARVAERRPLGCISLPKTFGAGLTCGSALIP